MTIYAGIKNGKEKVAVGGLGYVGFPLAMEFGKIVKTIGFDLSERRINELKRGYDSTNEISPEEIKAAKHLRLTTDPKELRQARFIIEIGRASCRERG